jgi:hypothetical protein
VIGRFGPIRGAVLPALAVLALASCAAPSRRLTPRVVEDPIVLPKRMASVSTEIRYVHYEPTNAGGTSGQGGFRFGLTNRLEWVDLLGLRFAILDDRPADGRTPMPFSLALRAGLVGIGYSSAEGTILLPVAALHALKHVADRWALSLALGWGATWSPHPVAVTPAYSGSLAYSGRIKSTFTLSAAVTRQLAERTALGIMPAVHQTNDCVDPTCGWVSRGASVALVVHERPWDWLTISIGPGVGVRNRPDVELPTMYPSGTPITIPPTTVTWFGFAGTAAFYW